MTESGQKSTDPDPGHSEPVRKRSAALVPCLLISALAYSIFIGHGVAPAVVGYNLVPAERVMNGEVPYRDFLYNYTPGLLWLNALLFKVGGASLLTARAGVFAAKLATMLLLFALGRRLLPGWLPLIPVLMTIAWVGYGDVLKVFPTQYGIPIALACCLAVLKAGEKSGDGRRAGWILAAGLLAGLVFMFKQNVGLFTIIAAVGGVMWNEHRAWKQKLVSGSQVFLGFGLVASPLFIYLAANDSLAPMVSHFSRHATAYSEAKGIGLPSPLQLGPGAVLFLLLIAIFWLLRKSNQRIIAGYWGVVALLLAVLIALGERGPTAIIHRSLVAHAYYLPIYVALLALYVALIVKRSSNAQSTSEDLRKGEAIPIVALFSLAVFLEIFPRSDADHLVRTLPPSMLLLCALGSFIGALRLRAVAATGMKEVEQRGSTGQRQSLLVAKPLVLAICVVISALGIRVTWWPQFGPGGLMLRENSSLRFDRGEGVAGTAAEASRLNAVVDFVQTQTTPQDRILALSRKMTGVYFFAARPNTTRLLWPDSAGIDAAERSLIETRIVNRDFDLILLGVDDGEPDQDPAFQHTLAVAAGHYRVAAIVNGIRMMVPGE